MWLLRVASLGPELPERPCDETCRAPVGGRLGRLGGGILILMYQATRYTTIRRIRVIQLRILSRNWREPGSGTSGFPSKWMRPRDGRNGARIARVLEVAPAECHPWLGAIERRHQVVRWSPEVFMDDLGERTKRNLVQAAIYVAGQINQLSFVKGFTPTQWITNKSVTDIGSLTEDAFLAESGHPGRRDCLCGGAEAELAARQAFFKADGDAKLRRAMNCAYYENMNVLKVGQQGTRHLTKNKWRGPARGCDGGGR